ncbi:YybH family protein [Amycolatopsis jejuensis]|uniref:YybH family protein n=1 Tax=Amycolatopsis jejuensis TaxID=330084 RepID=UPI00069259DC|nr:nuclear transport factor 2 family protein [Amycolatopsis jejuensis]
MSTAVLPTSQPNFSGPAGDVEAVREAHRDWWAANFTREMGRRKRSFAPDTLMFNLNGHTYYGLDEMVQVWSYYTDNIDNGVPELWDYRIFVSGDLAYLTCEGVFLSRAKTEQGWGTSNATLNDQASDFTRIRFRETSVLRRDDGEGNPVWKIWHFHCSPAAPADEERPGFGDTWTSRGGDLDGAIPQTPELPAPAE